MSPFMIFALVLTVLYAVYYGVVIARDLHGKKARSQSTEEVFDLGDMGKEESVEVLETEDSFRVGGAGAEQPEIAEEAGTAEVPGNTPGTGRNEAEEKAERIRSGLSEAEVESEDGVDAPTLHELLEGKRETLFKPQMTVTRNEV